VLLKNAGGLLPLDFKQTKTIAVVGTFAGTPRQNKKSGKGMAKGTPRPMAGFGKRSSK
jgi:beta-glucosidase-like glycosyl hydrolase